MVKVKEARARYLTNVNEEQTASEKNVSPGGYMSTEVGMVPNDWSVKPIGGVLSIRHGRSQKEIVCIDGIYPVLGTGGEIDRTNIPLYSKPSVLIGRKGTINKPRFIDTPFWTVDTLFYSEINVVNDAKFIFYKFCLIDWMSYNEASGVPSLNASTIENIPLSFPINKSEQTAIAKALSDIDTLIISLEKLITKKQAIKTTTMQQLLTGKKRLLGFGEGKGYKQTELGEIPEDWTCVKLVDMAELGTGNTPPTMDSSNYGSDYLFVSPSDLGWHKWVKDTDKKLSLKGFNLSRKFPANSILFTCIGSTIGKIGIASFELTSNQQINAVFPNGSCNSEYIYYSLDYAVPRIKILAGNQAVPIINKTEFGETLIPLPKINAEQTAIANVLSVMDSEIDLLENRLNKTQQIKQGMMQELLTGRTRLI
ncbi:MAG: restriction endonuclease subunit S [Methylococcales bacterium]|nr:restriction endonuclease subunit S [Methylococcales bacterium]